MASPFRTFRKYQKSLLVVAGVVLMFVFVLGEPLSQYFNQRAGGSGPAGRRPGDVAVKWKDGQLTNAELNQLVVQRLVVNGFLRQVEALGRQAAIEAGGEPQPLRVEIILGPEKADQGVERDVLRMRLAADAARKAGMAISDEQLVNYLVQLGRGFVTPDVLRQVLNGMNVGGHRASTDYVLDALREEMLARNFLQSYIFAFDTNLPEQRWSDWLNVNDRVVVEAAAVPAASLLADVKEPTDAELKEFFDEYKNNEPMPESVGGVELPSPNPGFAIPRKVATQYLLADFNQYLTKVEDEITEEEIVKFYEDNKDPHFIQDDSILNHLGGEAESAAADEPKATETPAANAAESKETPAATEEKPAAEEQPAAEKKADDATTTAPKAEDGSAAQPRSPFRLAAYAEETAAGDETKAAASEAESAAAAETAAPATSEPTAEKPSDVEKPAAEANSAAPAAADVAAPAEKPKQYQPLEDVRDQIRRQLAEMKVNEQLQTLMSKVEGELNAGYMEYFGATLDAESTGKPAPKPPEKLLDLTPLAKEHGLVYQKTEPASMLQLRDTPVGGSVRPDQGGMPLYYSIFGRDVEFFQPIATYDLDNNRYLVMKTDDVPGKVPTLDEVRDEVVRAWKMRKAGELALQRAEALAKKAQDHSGTLQEAFADDSSVLITKTDPFAYLTIGTIARDTQQVQSFRLSKPEGIDAAGPAFMEKVFNLKDGEVGAVLNNDHSAAYVVKIAEHQNTPAELQQAFLDEADTWYGNPAMARGRSRTAVRVVLADMFESAGVDWLRNPDQVTQPEDEASADAQADNKQADNKADEATKS